MHTHACSTVKASVNKNSGQAAHTCNLQVKRRKVSKQWHGCAQMWQHARGVQCEELPGVGHPVNVILKNCSCMAAVHACNSVPSEHVSCMTSGHSTHSACVECAVLPLVAMQTAKITMQACRDRIKPMLVHAGTPLHAWCMELHGRMGDRDLVHAMRWQDTAQPCTAAQAL